MAEPPELDFAGLLRRLRSAAGLTQEKLAEAARLSPRTVSDLERGVNRSARKDTAALLADAIGLTGPARELFVAAGRGQVPAAQALAAASADPAAGPTAHVVTAAGTLALAPAVTVPRELPADVVAFTGRGVELAELDLLLPTDTPAQDGSPGPVVISVVSGSAGVGKTALAVRWAHRAAAEFPDGQLYVNLRGFDPDQPVTADEALAGFLRALGVPSGAIPLGEAERAARYRSLVAGRRLLVVLDNAATVEQVRPLLPGTPSVMVLVTSRDALAGLVARDGARRLDLDLLSAGEAVTLLRTLIGARADADAVATRALAGLCARLPLALRVAAELAVARPDTPLGELAEELADQQDRLELLDAGGDPRSAVANVFSWSYRHLPPDAALMFRLLGLHPGQDWDRYAAAALTATGSLGRASRLLAVLDRAHLIQPAGRGRYQMHDLLRAYAAGLAASTEGDAEEGMGRRAVDGGQAGRDALGRLLGYYLAASSAAMRTLAPAERHRWPIPPAVGTPVPEFTDRAGARAWLDTEMATLTAVSAHAAAHGWPGFAGDLATTLYRHLYNSHPAEGLTIHTLALNAARDSGDQAAEASALTSLGAYHSRQDRYQEAGEHHQRALDVARATGDRYTEARALVGLGTVHDWQNRPEQAIDSYSRALDLFRELGDQVGQVRQLNNIGGMYLRLRQYTPAVDQLSQALSLGRDIDAHDIVANALVFLGTIRWRQAQYEQAAGYLHEAVTVSRGTGNRFFEGRALTRLGDVYLRQGEYQQAVVYHQQALALCRQIGNPGAEADALNGTGETLLATGQPEQARACHTTALTLARQTDDHYEQARSLARLGTVSHSQAFYEQAAAYHQQALALFRQIGDQAGEADALNGAGETLLAAGQPGQAQDCHTTALALARKADDNYQQARAQRGLAAAHQPAGQLEISR
ncbi:MAG TPA: tetratricopeptide repeat protein [Streptosporangiaceae bacterium]|nr:tetratricopeptide repeat protein [Streptosporangiaceae bacterium]